MTSLFAKFGRPYTFVCISWLKDIRVGLWIRWYLKLELVFVLLFNLNNSAV